MIVRGQDHPSGHNAGGELTERGGTAIPSQAVWITRSVRVFWIET